jgi:cytochrome P450
MKHVKDVQKQVDQDIKPTRETIFHQLMDPSAAEGHIVPRAADLADEAFAICTAAADTTGNAMGMAAYKTITNPEIYAKVKKELQDAFPDASAPMKFTDLEKLPYLTGIIKEGQR